MTSTQNIKKGTIKDFYAKKKIKKHVKETSFRDMFKYYLPANYFIQTNAKYRENDHH